MHACVYRSVRYSHVKETCKRKQKKGINHPPPQKRAKKAEKKKEQNERVDARASSKRKQGPGYPESTRIHESTVVCELPIASMSRGCVRVREVCAHLFILFVVSKVVFDCLFRGGSCHRCIVEFKPIAFRVWPNVRVIMAPFVVTIVHHYRMQRVFCRYRSRSVT